jgi:hypothetical protein
MKPGRATWEQRTLPTIGRNDFSRSSARRLPSQSKNAASLELL